MDIYKNWDTFISKIDIVSQQLDEEKLVAMVKELSCTRKERVLLKEKAISGDRTSFESLVKSYISIIVSSMNKYASRIGYDRDVLMNCIEKLREMLANSLYIDNLEDDISQYISWMVNNEISNYITSSEIKQQEISDDTLNEESKYESVQEMIDKISEYISDEYRAELIKKLLLACKNDKERQLIGFRYGLEDGTFKTLQETADKFKITRERARMIEAKIIRRITPHLRRRKSLSDFIND